MTVGSITELVRALLKREGVSLSVDGLEEAAILREVVLLVQDSTEISLPRAEGSTISAIRRQRWDDEPTAPIPTQMIERLTAAAR